MRLLSIPRVAGLLAALAAFGCRAEYVPTFIEESRAWGSVVADFNNDGHDDIFITGHDSDDRIWYWTPNGYAPSVQAFDWVDRHDCDAADVDHNGRLDLYCAVGAEGGFGSGAKQLWLQGTDGVFRKAANFGAEDPFGRGRIPIFLDFNHDGWADIYLTNEFSERPDGQGNYNRLFINQAGKGFVEHVTVATGAKGFLCAAKGDINGDGWDDLLTCDGSNPGRIFINNRAGDFVEMHLAANSVAWVEARLADVNADGRDDLLVGTEAGKFQLWLNTGSGDRFVTPTINASLGATAQSMTVGDFNQDGLRDIYVVLSKTSCKKTLVDNWADVVYQGKGRNKWTKVVQPQQAYPGCGHLAETVDGHQVLLMNGGISYFGPNYLLSWTP